MRRGRRAQKRCEQSLTVHEPANLLAPTCCCSWLWLSSSSAMRAVLSVSIVCCCCRESWSCRFCSLEVWATRVASWSFSCCERTWGWGWGWGLVGGGGNKQRGWVTKKSKASKIWNWALTCKEKNKRTTRKKKINFTSSLFYNTIFQPLLGQGTHHMWVFHQKNMAGPGKNIQS